jgi:D-alanyl-D-alanine carboxypeptidase (penicillin-binding protein 5/6)
VALPWVLLSPWPGNRLAGCLASDKSIGKKPRVFERKRVRDAQAVAVVVALLFAMTPSFAFGAALSSDLVDGGTPAKRNVQMTSMPDVSMAAGALVDGEGRQLWSRSANDRRPMASITKIMTAVVALENSSLQDPVTVPRASGAVGESTAFLRPGETLPMRDLLVALLVKSGNDAAVAIAQKVGGTEPQFVQMMNDKAVALGLSDTHFQNPHGLDAKGHYTTANDLAVLSRYAMSKPEFRSIVSMKTATIGKGKRTEKLTSTDLLIGNYQGAMGVKTGFTNGAGYSVVSAAEREGVTLYAVVLGTKTELQRFREAKSLLDWGFAHYRPMALAEAGTIVGLAPVSDYLDVTVPAAISRDATVPVLDLAGPIKREVTVATVKAPIAKGDTVGVATFKQAGKTILTVPVVATGAVAKPNPFQVVWFGTVRAWRRVFR